MMDRLAPAVLAEDLRNHADALRDHALLDVLAQAADRLDEDVPADVLGAALAITAHLARCDVLARSDSAKVDRQQLDTVLAYVTGTA